RHRGASHLAFWLGAHRGTRAARARDARRYPARESGLRRRANRRAGRVLHREAHPQQRARARRRTEANPGFRQFSWAGNHAADDQGSAARSARGSEPPDFGRQHPENGRRLLQGPRDRHAFEEALARGGAPPPGSDGAREGAHAIVAPGNREQLRRPRPHDRAARMPANREIARIVAGPQSRRQFPAASPAQLAHGFSRDRSGSGAFDALEKTGWNGYNLGIKRPGGRTLKKPPNRPQPEQQLYRRTLQV